MAQTVFVFIPVKCRAGHLIKGAQVRVIARRANVSETTLEVSKAVPADGVLTGVTNADGLFIGAYKRTTAAQDLRFFTVDVIAYGERQTYSSQGVSPVFDVNFLSKSLEVFGSFSPTKIGQFIDTAKAIVGASSLDAVAYALIPDKVVAMRCRGDADDRDTLTLAEGTARVRFSEARSKLGDAIGGRLGARDGWSYEVENLRDEGALTDFKICFASEKLLRDVIANVRFFTLPKGWKARVSPLNTRCLIFETDDARAGIQPGAKGRFAFDVNAGATRGRVRVSVSELEDGAHSDLEDPQEVPGPQFAIADETEAEPTSVESTRLFTSRDRIRTTAREVFRRSRRGGGEDT